VPPAPPAPVADPGAISPPPPAPTPAPIQPGRSNFPPENNQRVEYRWQPAPGQTPPGVQLQAPEPDIAESGKRVKPSPPAVQEKSFPPPSDAAIPVEIPHFTPIKDKVLAGRRPGLEGLDWLRAKGYKTVLFVHKPGEEIGSDRKQVEKRGMKFVSLEVSAQTFSKDTVADFQNTVGATASYPLFVYDRDGSLAGALWYVYFRRVENLSDDAARIQAGALGFRDDRDEHREMWLAVQKFLQAQ
jgi:protein tyrosine phosphatase (PTP) superfamily phosphohydrolase (DUF442 family)